MNNILFSLKRLIVFFLCYFLKWQSAERNYAVKNARYAVLISTLKSFNSQNNNYFRFALINFVPIFIIKLI